MRAFEFVLIAAITLGVYFTVSSSRQLRLAQAEYARLNRTTGDLEVIDPSQVHVLAIESTTPYEFFWRVYTPKNYKFQERINQFDRTSGWLRDSSDSIYGVSFAANHAPSKPLLPLREGDKFSNFELQPSGLLEFMREHWAELKVEQLGAGSCIQVKAGSPFTLLRISAPEALMDEAKAKFATDRSFLKSLPVLFEWQLSY